MKTEKNFGRFFLMWTLALSLAAVINSCKKDDNKPDTSGTPPANEVWMQSNSFNPSSITVSRNTTITWRNKDGVNHTVTSTSGSELNSGTIAGGGSFPHTFADSGTFNYHCNFHGGMTGTVIVH